MSDAFSVLLDFKSSFLNEMERLETGRGIQNKVLKASLTQDLGLGKVCCLTVTEDFFLQTFPAIL